MLAIDCSCWWTNRAGCIKSPEFKWQPPIIPACRGGRTNHHGLDSQWPSCVQWPHGREAGESLQVMLGGWLSLPRRKGGPPASSPREGSRSKRELFSDALTPRCPGHACFYLANGGPQECRVVLSRMVSAVGRKLCCWAH